LVPPRGSIKTFRTPVLFIFESPKEYKKLLKYAGVSPIHRYLLHRGGSRGGVEGVATPPLSSISIFLNSSLKKIRTKLSFTKLFHFHHSPAFADLKR